MCVVLSALTFTVRCMVAAVLLLTALTRCYYQTALEHEQVIPHIILYLSQLPWPHTAILLLAGVCAVLYRGYEEESILVIKGLGVQVTSSSRFYFGSTSKFFPTRIVRDMIINEAFIWFQVRFYLALIIEGSTSLTVVFPQLLPRRKIVETVYQKARDCLYN